MLKIRVVVLGEIITVRLKCELHQVRLNKS